MRDYMEFDCTPVNDRRSTSERTGENRRKPRASLRRSPYIPRLKRVGFTGYIINDHGGIERDTEGEE